MREATRSDIGQLMGWFETADATTRWAGPNFAFPFTRESFLRDLKWPAVHSYCLVNDEDTMVGFGQFYEKFGRNHLARIAVDPQARGHGHGVALVRGLAASAGELFPGRDTSLYVYLDNAAAIRCYRRAGFEDAAAPDEGESYKSCLFMILPAAGH